MGRSSAALGRFPVRDPWESLRQVVPCWAWKFRCAVLFMFIIIALVFLIVENIHVGTPIVCIFFEGTDICYFVGWQR